MKTFLKKNIARKSAFTLIELLVVIAIIAVLAGFTIPVLSAVKVRQYKNVAQAELKQIEGALENYKAKYGIYPPGTNNPANTLYYELAGVTLNGGNYQTLDNASKVNAASFVTVFNTGIINLSKGSVEDGTVAKSFLPSLSAKRIGTYTSGVAYNILITAAGGPDDAKLTALNTGGFTGNPFYYLCPGTNNPSSYDLWVDLVIKGKTNRISNW